MLQGEGDVVGCVECEVQRRQSAVSRSGESSEVMRWRGVHTGSPVGQAG